MSGPITPEAAEEIRAAALEFPPAEMAMIMLVATVRAGLQGRMGEVILGKIDMDTFAETEMPSLLPDGFARDNETIFAFRMVRDELRRVWFISIPNGEDSKPDFTRPSRVRVQEANLTLVRPQ